ncbi:MAG TPA: SDR family oxidoreductase [Parvularculaceae bacterium]|nr:SDR family oxidoreductase [Parvularculaceae bacterium]
MRDLKGKTILVTGASRGIGAAIARGAAETGARVILHASATGGAIDKVAAEIGAPASDVICEDLSAADAGFRLFDRALDAARKIDGVVNNAGVYIESRLNGLRSDWTESWSNTHAVNVQAPADVCHAAIGHFRQTGGGIVVNVASRAGHRGDSIDGAAYAASKGAVLAMTKTFARQLAGENMLFYALAPGWVETRMAPKDIEARARAVSEIPLGRVADPEEVAAIAIFLLTGACASATGATFDVNGASYVR